MIITTLPNTTPYSYGSANACKLLGPSLPEIVTPEVVEFCICDYVQCEYVEKVFAEIGGEYWKNDKNEFLFKRIVPVDTVDIELYKDGVKIADLNNNTYGTFFNGFASGSSEQQLYVGYLLDWELVATLNGFGYYQVKTQLNILGNVSEVESRTFNLMGYSDQAAHETVRIESTQNGNIIGNTFDFTGLNWYQSFRVPAVFGNPTPTTEQVNYKTQNRNFRQIKSTNSREWTLKTKKLSWEVADKLIYNKMLANEILITDYNILAESAWRRIGVFPSEIDKPSISGNPNKVYNITFTDNKDIFLKRNF